MLQVQVQKKHVKHIKYILIGLYTFNRVERNMSKLISEATAGGLGGQTIEEMHIERDAETDQRIGHVFRTMLFFTTLMVLGPIMTYFFSRTYVFEGNIEYFCPYV